MDLDRLGYVSHKLLLIFFRISNLVTFYRNWINRNIKSVKIVYSREIDTRGVLFQKSYLKIDNHSFVSKLQFFKYSHQIHIHLINDRCVGIIHVVNLFYCAETGCGRRKFYHCYYSWSLEIMLPLKISITKLHFMLLYFQLLHRGFYFILRSNELLSTESEFALTHRPVACNRLSTSSRISDFTSISIQFLVDLLLPSISTHVSLPSGRIFLIVHCLGQFPWFCGELLNYSFGSWIKSVFDCLNLYLSYAGVIFNSWPRWYISHNWSN